MQLKQIFSLPVLLLGLAGLTGLNGPVLADTLVIDTVKAAPAGERPAKGQSMATVEASFGKPAEVVAAVGQPPITRWVYDGFTVYFEGDKVLHAVSHR